MSRLTAGSQSSLREANKGLLVDTIKQFGGLTQVELADATGLSAATVARRTREIGIRKALGASSTNILRMLLWQFSKPVVYASLIAWPASAFLLNRWLEGFATHIDLSPLTFFAAAVLALAIALATVATHALKVAHARPVVALRYE